MEKFPKDENIIEGEGFTVRDSRGSIPVSFAEVEFKPGESTETAHLEKERRMNNWSKRENESAGKVNDLTDAEHTEDQLRAMLKIRNPYFEIFKIKSDGTFNKKERVDGSPMYLAFVNNPTDLYSIAEEIEKEHPDYHFSFETDPGGKWMKYTVSKD